MARGINKVILVGNPRGINKVILVGNLGDDPETKYTNGGMAVTTIRLATTTVRKGRDGAEPAEKTEWHRVKFFGKLAEIAGEYLRKGSQCYVEGRISYDEFTGTDGVKKYYTDIVCDEMQMLGGKGDGQQRQAPKDQQRSEAKAAPVAATVEDDDIPF